LEDLSNFDAYEEVDHAKEKKSSMTGWNPQL
jgi:hypothetical protein